MRGGDLQGRSFWRNRYRSPVREDLSGTWRSPPVNEIQPETGKQFSA